MKQFITTVFMVVFLSAASATANVAFAGKNCVSAMPCFAGAAKAACQAKNARRNICPKGKKRKSRVEQK